MAKTVVDVAMAAEAMIEVAISRAVLDAAIREEASSTAIGIDSIFGGGCMWKDRETERQSRGLVEVG